MNSLNHLPPVLPSLSGATALRGGAAGAADGAGVLLRAEVEPSARGLGVQAHAERVLAALQAEPVMRRNT